MGFETIAQDDFDRARWKAFWRRVTALITGKSNQLLPFDEVRGRLPLKGQHYVGLQQVPIDKIVGSQGRYLDFDRAFLPVQSRTRDRWVSIDKAHYSQVALPAVDLFKMGEIYFVKDGNHRVSVARQRGQEFIDAFVIEIDVPIKLSADVLVDDLVLQEEYVRFVEITALPSLRQEASFVTRNTGDYDRLLEHINAHRWFMGEQQGLEVSYTDAVISWYDTVYLPLVTTLKENNVLRSFRGVSETDLYLLVMDYQWYLREVYREEPPDENVKEQIARHLAENYPIRAVNKLLKTLRKAGWFEELVLEQERIAFEAHARLSQIRPESSVRTTVPGQYQVFYEHIDVHRWYLGEQRQAEVPYLEAVGSWYDHVFLPLANFIREGGILDAFPGRTEADLYLWIMKHQYFLNSEYGEDVPVEIAAEQFASDYGSKEPKKD